MKRLLYLAMVALVAMLILVPTALAQEATLPKTGGQEQTVEMEQTIMMEKDLPKSGGPGVGSLAAPVAALLVGSAILGYAVMRRR